jgi:hypothetical protein
MVKSKFTFPTRTDLTDALKDFIPKPKSLPCQLYFVVKLSLNQPLPLKLFIPFSQFLFKRNTALHCSPTNDLQNDLCVARISLNTGMTTWIKRPDLRTEDNEMAVHWCSEDSGVARVNSEYTTVQYRTVQYSTAQYNTEQYSTVQYNTVQYSTVQYRTVQYSTVQYRTVQYSTVQYITVQYSTV